jgi:UDP-3-O-[3-hydroxymyristoyl] glucosamine N-acyltransferase
VVLIAEGWAEEVPDGTVAVVVKDPHQALYSVLTELYPPAQVNGGIHPSAVVSPTARLASDVSVGAYAVVGEGVEIGARTVVGPHAVIGPRTRIGSDVVIHSHATVHEGVQVGDRCVIHSGARIGNHGFGFIFRDGGFQKIPQVGGCVLEDDVEVGPNSTIDRGSVGDTVVGRGSKIDALVHLGHNVRLGRHVMLAGQAGVSGSTTIGDGAALGGQVGVGGHLTIGPGARIGAQAGVISDVPAGETYSGYPARPHREALRAQAGAFRLPELLRRLKKLEEAIFGRGADIHS